MSQFPEYPDYRSFEDLPDVVKCGAYFSKHWYDVQERVAQQYNRVRNRVAAGVFTVAAGLGFGQRTGLFQMPEAWETPVSVGSVLAVAVMGVSNEIALRARSEADERAREVAWVFRDEGIYPPFWAQKAVLKVQPNIPME